MKYKVGDMVRVVRNGSQMPKVGEIHRIAEIGDLCYRLDVPFAGWVVEDDIELVSSPHAQRFWMVMVDGRSMPTKRHDSWHSAKLEAERLARMDSNRGRQVFILEMNGVCQTADAPVEWGNVL